MALQDIQTIIIVVMENRSFDHVLGYLSMTDGNPAMPLEGLRDDPAWRGPRANLYQGEPYPIHPLDAQTQKIDDPPHEQATIAHQINTPTYPGSPYTMGGFVESYMQAKTAPQDRSLVMGYYTKSAVPIFDFFARNFTVCDHWFAALPTGTQANRLMLMSGESSIVDNAPVFLSDQPLVYDWLSNHQIPWCAYQWGDFLPFFSLMPRWLPEITTSLAFSALGGKGRFRRYSAFREQWLSAAELPSVIFIEPEYTDGPHLDANDDHPPTGISKGQSFLADIYATLISNSARWQNTMLIVTYDEHGGFYDHVPPLPIKTTVAGFPFPTTGVRVPAFVISPHVKPGEVFKGELDHTSILQLLADRFNPGQDYSAAVGARQPQLVRLASALSDAPQPRAPAIPDATLLALQASYAAAALAPTESSAAPGAAANSIAFHNVALKVAQDHPDLLNSPGWETLAQYLK